MLPGTAAPVNRETDGPTHEWTLSRTPDGLWTLWNWDCSFSQYPDFQSGLAALRNARSGAPAWYVRGYPIGPDEEEDERAFLSCGRDDEPPYPECDRYGRVNGRIAAHW